MREKDDELKRLVSRKDIREVLLSFLPMEIIKRISVKPKELDRVGERRELTALFADISGFTSIAEKLDPEEVMRIVNEFFGELLTLVDQYGGSVDKFLGDGIMILFGVPLSHPDDARRALELSFAILEAVEKFNKRKLVFGSKRLKLELSIGVNTGNVVAGIVGSDFHREFTVLGDPVNIAARLEAVAKSGEIIVGERTYELTKDFFTFLPLEPLYLKGKSEPVKAYKLVGKKEQREFLAGEPVGRQKEIEEFSKFLTARDRNILFIGDEGTGKSYLLTYLVGLAKQKNRSCIVLAPLPWEKRLHFSACRLVLSYIISMVGQNRLKYYLSPHYRQYISLLNELAKTNFKVEKDLVYFAEEEKGRYLSEVLYEIIFNFITKNDLFIAIDGLENLDSGSSNVLLKIARTRAGTMVATLTESQEKPDIQGFRYVRLKRMTIVDVRQFLKSGLGEVRVPKKLVDFLYKESDGKYLYLSELFDFLRDEGYISVRGKRVLFRVPDESVGGQISNLFLVRLDKMEPQLRELVQTMSVLGLSFPLPVIQEYYKYSLSRELIEFLVRKGIIKLEPKGALYWVSFKNQLFQRSVYCSLLLSARERIHLELARLFQQIFKRREEEFYSTIAYHYQSGNDFLSAGRYYIKAAFHESKLYAVRESLFFFEKALENLSKVKGKAKSDLLTVYIGRFKFLWFLGELDKALKEQRFAAAIAKQTKDYSRLAEALLGIGLIQSQRGAYALAERIYKKALEFAENSPYVRVEILSNLGILFSERFDFLKGKEYYGLALDIAKRHGYYVKEADIYTNLGWIAMKESNYAEAIRNFTLALEIDKRLNNIEGQALDHINFASVYADLGDWQQMMVSAQSAYDLFARAGRIEGQILALNHIGEALRELGEADKGLSYHRRALRLARKHSAKKGETDAIRNLGLDYLAKGELQKSLKYLDLSLNIASRLSDWEGVLEAYFGFLRFWFVKQDKANFVSTLKKIKEITEGKGPFPLPRLKVFLDDKGWSDLIYKVLG